MINACMQAIDRIAEESLCTGWLSEEEVRSGPDGIRDTYYGKAMAYIHQWAVCNETLARPIKLRIAFTVFAIGRKTRVHHGVIRHACETSTSLTWLAFDVLFDPYPWANLLVVPTEKTELYIQGRITENNDGYLNAKRTLRDLRECHELGTSAILRRCMGMLNSSLNYWEQTPSDPAPNQSGAYLLERAVNLSLHALQVNSSTNYAIVHTFDEEIPGGDLGRISGTVGSFYPNVRFRMPTFSIAHPTKTVVQLTGELMTGVHVYLGDRMLWPGAARVKFNNIYIEIDYAFGFPIRRRLTLRYDCSLPVGECKPSETVDFANTIVIDGDRESWKMESQAARHPYEEFLVIIAQEVSKKHKELRDELRRNGDAVPDGDAHVQRSDQNGALYAESLVSPDLQPLTFGAVIIDESSQPPFEGS